LFTTLRRKIGKIWLALTFAAVSSSAAVAVVVWWLGPIAGQVREVRFEGARLAAEPGLRHLADLHRGTLLRDVDLGAVERRVQRHPWVSFAEARREGSAVVVRVKERRAVALVLTDDLYLVDERGVPFLRADRQFVDLPVIFGLTPDVVALHPDLPGAVVRASLQLVDSLQELPVPGSPEVAEVRWSASRGYDVAFGRSRLLFGLQDVLGQLDRLRRMVDKGTVDLTKPTLVDLAPRSVAIVRPLGASALPQLSSHAAR
jgi:hypothetical protein